MATRSIRESAPSALPERARLDPRAHDECLARRFGLVRIPAVTTLVGACPGAGQPQESPQFEATLGGYWIARRCVTAGQFYAFVNDPQSGFDELWCDFLNPCFILRTTEGYRLRPDASEYPMVQVSFVGAAAYCNWLSRVFGLDPVYRLEDLAADLSATGFRLPTEAEWEHACEGPDASYGRNGAPPADHVCGPDLAGPAAELCAGRRRIGGFSPSQPSPVPVGTMPPNGYGLHEMLGNVNEWCHDRYGPYTPTPKKAPSGPPRGSFRVIRGGSFITSRDQLSASYRHAIHQEAKCMIDGFRLARST